jgi:hypothetical protein
MRLIRANPCMTGIEVDVRPFQSHNIGLPQPRRQRKQDDVALMRR